MNAAAQKLIEDHQLEVHPEGGYYKRIYLNGNIGSAIYYLLIKGDYSHFHRIQSDEMWHFYEGNKVVIHLIDEELNYRTVELSEINRTYLVPKNTWMAAEINEEGYSFVGCTLWPAFSFDAFELASKDLFQDVDEIVKGRLDRLFLK